MNLRTLIITLCIGIITSVSAQDWAGYHVYADANDTVTQAPEVVFIGNSITQMWLEAHPEWFTKHHFAPRGIGGQTSQHMLCRFQEDVINLHPKRVMILSGVNDIARNNGEISLKHVVENILSMCQLAEANNIQPYVCSPLPANYFYWNPSIVPGDSIAELRRLLSDMAEKNNYPFVDYYPDFFDAHSNPSGGMYDIYTIDGVHLNSDGYNLLEIDALDALSSPMPKASARITFDDGLLEHYTIVRPLLNRYGMTGTFFVISEHVDKKKRELGAKPMSWKQIKQLHDDGHIIGNHTATHPNMAELSEDEIMREYNTCDSAIFRHIGVHPNFFAYPYHAHSEISDSLLYVHSCITDIRSIWEAGFTHRPNWWKGPHVSVSIGGNECPTEADIQALLEDIVRRKQHVTFVIHGITKGWDAWSDTRMFEYFLMQLKAYQDRGLLTIESPDYGPDEIF